MDSLFEAAFHEIVNSKIPSKVKELITVLINDCDLYSPNWHALGFVHCKLASFSQGTLRLHIWPPQERHSQEQVHKIHDHIFSLTSYVICGSIKNEIYRVQNVPKNLASTQCYDVEYLENSAELIATGKYYNEVKISETVVGIGEHYTVMSGHLHQTSVPKSRFVVTLVATYDHKVAAPRLLGPIDGSHRFSRKKINYDKEKWIKLLRNVEKIL